MTQDTTDRTESKPFESVSRRTLITAIGIAGAGAAGHLTGRAAAQTPSGTFPIQGEDPLLKIRADRIRYIPRSSDPSSPDGGTTWVVQ